MEKFIEYIMMNYTWILGISIMILLAVIGYYADKTNFGQGKNKDEHTNDEELVLQQSLEEKKLNDIVNDNLLENNIVEDISDDKQLEELKVDLKQDESKINFEQTFEKFDKEFNEFLPKKEIIDDELLFEIDSLSLDKTQKIDLTDIPDLDDVELPKIKELQPEEEDIWKF